MRIAVVNNFFPPRVGGSSHLSDSLATAYAAAGHEVIVITAAYQDAPNEEIRDEVRIVRLRSWTLPRLGTSIDFDVSFAVGPRNLRRLFHVLDEFQPDVIHQHGQFLDLTWMSSMYARRRRVPVLLSIHTRLEGTSRGYAALFRVLDAVLVRPFIALARPTVVVMDRLMQRYISDRYGIPPDRLVDIPVGVDTSHSVRPRDRDIVRERLDIGDRPMILSLGHVIPLRDRLALVEALTLVIDRFPTVAVVIVGEVNYPAFLDRADELGIRDRFLCTGPVPRNEVADYLAAADVEVHDLQGLGLGTASLEAMLAEVPVVAAVGTDNFPGLELCDGENITLVPVGEPAALSDAICGLLDDPERRRRIGAAQRAFVEANFSLDTVTRLHLEALGHLANRTTA